MRHGQIEKNKWRSVGQGDPLEDNGPAGFGKEEPLPVDLHKLMTIEFSRGLSIYKEGGKVGKRCVTEAFEVFADTVWLFKSIGYNGYPYPP